MPFRRPLVAVALAAGLLLGSWHVAAGEVPVLPPVVGSTTTTTSPPPPPDTTTTTTTTTAKPSSPSGGGETPSPPPAAPSPSPFAPPAGAPAADPGGAPVPAGPGPAPAPAAPGVQAPLPPGDGSPPPSPTMTVPPEAQALMDAVVRSRASSTERLVAALRPLEDFGFSPQDAALAGFGHFPVAGPGRWSHDWLYPRFVPSFHLHEGTDIFAPEGTPVRAPFAGTLRMVDGAVSGLAAYVTTSDRTYFFLGHLSSFAPGLVEGQAVEQGQVLGTVGATGNAAGTPPHVHFEIHPRGGGPVDPKATLDAWVEEAIREVPALLARYQSRTPRALLATGLTRRLDSPDQPGTTFSSSRSPLLWASSVSPTGGAVGLAEIEAAAVVRSVDWDALARQAQARLARQGLPGGRASAHSGHSH